MIYGMRFAFSFYQPDEMIVFVEERGQIRPADDDCTDAGGRATHGAVAGAERKHIKGEATLTIRVGGEAILVAEGCMTSMKSIKTNKPALATHEKQQCYLVETKKIPSKWLTKA